jgi:hypothetical protein
LNYNFRNATKKIGNLHKAQRSIQKDKHKNDKKSLFIDAKRVIGSHNSKTGGQCNGQKEKNDKQCSKNITQKTED